MKAALTPAVPTEFDKQSGNPGLLLDAATAQPAALPVPAYDVEAAMAKLIAVWEKWDTSLEVFYEAIRAELLAAAGSKT